MTTNHFREQRAELIKHPRPAPLDGDDVAAAGDLINFVLDRCLELTDALYRYANLRLNEAPSTSQRTIELAGVIASETVTWVRRWGQ
ncbi:hypothetical protein [Nocardia sp. CA-119907]|uniref:hypothetical protein n=1 Tax=Nocardia sp. CA-119907 TaxID=3239973 RepID=UPI003D986BD1